MKNNLIFCIPQIYGGGAEQQIKYLANMFSQNFNVKIIVLNDKYKEELNPNIKLIKLKKISLQNLGSIFTFRNELVNSYVISSSAYFDILCGILKYFINIKWWIRESNSAKARKVTFKNSLRKFLGKRANGIVANSKSGYKYWHKSNKNSRIIFNGYPDEILERSKKKKKNFALIISRMQSHKNIKSGIDLFEILKKEGKVKKLIICGDGPELDEIKKYAKASLFADCIDIMGFVSHKKLQEILYYAKYFLSMSLYEGTPNSAIEALSNHCELFLSNSDSHKDFFPKSIVNFVNLETLEYQKNNKINTREIKQFLKKWKLKNTFILYKKVLRL